MRPDQARPIIDRLLDLVEPEPNTGCWLFTGNLGKGYGRMTVGSYSDGTRTTKQAHIVAY